MTTKALSELSKVALDATRSAAPGDALDQALQLVRKQTGAVAAMLFYGQDGDFRGAGSGDDPAAYSSETLRHLQQRLVHLRVPLSFNLDDGEVRFLTRASNKQPRDFIAWLVPAADSWTELLLLRGSWPPEAVGPLLEFIESSMPSLTIMVEHVVGIGRKRQLERQLATIEESAATLDRAAEVIGSVAAVRSSAEKLPTEQAQVLRALAEQASGSLEEMRASRDLMEAHLKLQEYTSRLEQAVREERDQATRDDLTGLLNHRGAIRLLEETIAGLNGNEDEALSLLLGDVDGFKLFNDTYGHVMGDDVLRLVADTCRKVAEPDGTVCRYGGDEFLIVLPGTDKAGAVRLAGEIAGQIGRASFHTEGNGVVPIRMSLGVAAFPDDTASPAKLVAIADAAMYEAKRTAQGADSGANISTRADTTFGVLESLVLAVDAKDRYTKDHCDIVAEYAVKLAERLTLSDEAKRALRIAGLLHDIGKLAVPDEILKKPAPLNQEEYEAMQRHVRIGEVLIREVPQLRDVIQAVSCHHERYDGSGYPRGLQGDAIPLLGRVIAIADAYSAMCLDRPYRKAMPHDQILREFVAGAGIQFDPEITREFVELLLDEQLRRKQPAA